MGGTWAPALWSDAGSEPSTLHCRRHSFLSLLGTAVSHPCFYITAVPHAHKAHKTSEPRSKEPLKPQPSQLPSPSMIQKGGEGLTSKASSGINTICGLLFFLARTFCPWRPQHRKEGGVGLKHQGKHQSSSESEEKLLRRGR